MIRNLPNALTLGNLFCGCLAAVAILHGEMVVGAWLVGVSLLLDWLDGTAARMCRIASPFGRELDSMADMVSFGVVPGAILYQILESTAAARFIGPPAIGHGFGPAWSAMPVFILSAFSGMRLAKFNLDPRQTDSFIGLPTPACTMFVLGIGLAWDGDVCGLRSFLGHNWVVYTIVALFSYLLVSEHPMYSLKIKDGRWPLLVGAVLVAAGLLFWFKGLGLSLLIGGYVVSSLLFFRKK